jgi:putative hydrolase of the HAD superfamily
VSDSIAAFLFDAGGVLVIPDPTVLGPLLTPYGGDPGVAAHHRAHYAGMAVKSRAGANERDWAEYDLAYVRAIGVPAHEEVEAAHLLGRTRSGILWRYPVASAVVALRELYARGIPIGVVSNASGQIEATLRRSAVCQVGDGAGVPVTCVIDSHVVGVEKPDPRIFGFALDALGLPPEKVAYVGDSVFMDVGGATAAGLRPFHVDPYDDFPHATHERIRSLDELLALV